MENRHHLGQSNGEPSATYTITRTGREIDECGDLLSAEDAALGLEDAYDEYALLVDGKVVSRGHRIDMECDRDERKLQDERKRILSRVAPNGEKLYFVERECGGRHAAGGGCGAYYISDVRPAVEDSKLIGRMTPDHERSFSTYEWLAPVWDDVDTDRSIWGGFWVCSSCRIP